MLYTSLEPDRTDDMFLKFSFYAFYHLKGYSFIIELDNVLRDRLGVCRKHLWAKIVMFLKYFSLFFFQMIRIKACFKILNSRFDIRLN